MNYAKEVSTMRKPKETRTFKIDRDALKEALKVRGLSAEKVSHETGRGKSYLSTCMTYGYVSDSEALLLDRMYGITRSEYERVEPTPEPEPVAETHAEEQTQTSTIDHVALYNTIYAAVYAALKANATDMREHLFDGRRCD